MLKMRAPGSPGYTTFILILFAGLLAYGFVKGDPIVFFILPVLLVFFGLPLLLVFVLNRASRRTTSEKSNGTATLSSLGNDVSLLDDRDSPDSNN